MVITSKVVVTVPLISDSQKSYYVPKGDLDFCLVVLDKESYPLLDSIIFWCLPDSIYASMKNLYVGQSVVFPGYPLDLSVNQVLPLLRKGMVAGIDTMLNVVYLDADAFAGSSGSPVFIDFSFEENKEFWNKHKQMLVGIISRYVPYKKYLKNVQTEKLEMIQTENSGIAVVVPAEAIREMADSLLTR